MFGKHRLGVRMRYDTWGVQSLKSLLFNRIMTNCLYICSRSAWDESSPNEAHKCALPAFTKNTIFWNIDYKNFINKVVLQASEGCDYTFLKCMWYKSLCIDKPSMSVTPPVWWVWYKVTCFDLPSMSIIWIRKYYYEYSMQMKSAALGAQSWKNLYKNNTFKSFHIGSRFAWDDSSPNETRKRVLPMFTKNSAY